MGIPPIIHQTGQYDSRWQQYNPAFGYWFWSDADVARFVQARYPAWLSVFHACEQRAWRLTLGRFLILKTFGGVGVAESCVCQAPIEPLLKTASFLAGVAANPQAGMTPACSSDAVLGASLVACMPEHPFWVDVLAAVDRVGQQSDLPKMAGVRWLTHAFEHGQNTDIALVPTADVGALPASIRRSGRVVSQAVLQDYVAIGDEGRNARGADVPPICNAGWRPRLSFITTSKHRLHHIKKTLPLLVSAGADEVVVVDYNCPQQTGAWVARHFPQVKVVSVTDDPGFCLPRARNLGAAAASGDWLVFVDADVCVQPGWVAWQQANLDPHFFYRAEPVDGQRDQETWGSFVCPKSGFDRVGGYDEAFQGWGGEDQDIYKRLAMAGLVERAYPARFVKAIRHDDHERVRYTNVKDIGVNHMINQMYIAAKLQAMHSRSPGQLSAQQPDMANRTALMKTVRQAVLLWAQNPAAQPLPAFSVKLTGQGGLPSPYVLNVRSDLTFEVVSSAS